MAQQSRRRPLSIQKVRRLERQVANDNDADDNLLIALMALLLLPEKVWECFPSKIRPKCSDHPQQVRLPHMTAVCSLSTLMYPIQFKPPSPKCVLFCC